MNAILGPRETGLAAEERYTKICQATRWPSYIEGFEPAPSLYDALGIDVIATVRRYQDQSLVEVPIQIKSSYGGRDAHYVKYPEHWLWRVVLVVVNDDHSDRAIVNQTIDELRHVRSHRYDYTPLFRAITSSTIPQERVNEIMARQYGYGN